MTKITYPIILHPENRGYSVEIPDINHGSWTQGESIEEAQQMAQDLIITMLTGQTIFPKPTPLAKLHVKAPEKCYLVTVEI